MHNNNINGNYITANEDQRDNAAFLQLMQKNKIMRNSYKNTQGRPFSYVGGMPTNMSDMTTTNGNMNDIVNVGIGKKQTFTDRRKPTPNALQMLKK